MNAEGWEIREYKVDGLRAMAKGLLYAFPFLLFVCGLYHVFLSGRAVLLRHSSLPAAAILILMACVPIHELLHGLGWIIAGHMGWDSIHFTFHHGMPFCSCRKLLASRQYLAGLMLPSLIMGGAGFMFLFLYPGTPSLLAALINCFMLGTDLVVACSVLQSGAALIADIPGQAGFVGVARK